MSGHVADPFEAYLAWEQRNAARAPGPAPDAALEPGFAGVGDDVRDRIGARVAAVRPELEDLARALYAEPELGFQEHKSVARIAELLRDHGVEVETGAWGIDTAFHATVGSGDGPHFAIVAEYDALPGVGHACGHNVIAGIAVGAFLAARDEVAATGGRLSLIGAPAEEGGGGKELIIRAGGFDDVDAAGMVHPGVGDEVSPVFGGRTSGVRRVRVTYHGRAGHAALSPYLGLNALDAVVTAYQSIAQLRQHILPIDRIHGIITDGGVAPNVVPERASAEFLIRSSEVSTLDALFDRVIAILQGAALATGTRAEIDADYVPAYLPLEQNVELVKRWAGVLRSRGRHVATAPAVERQGGPSTDMGNVSQYIPAIHPAIGLGAPRDVVPHGARFAEYTILPPAFRALEDAAVALGTTAVDFLVDAELRAAVAAEFEARGGRVTVGGAG